MRQVVTILWCSQDALEATSRAFDSIKSEFSELLSDGRSTFCLWTVPRKYTSRNTAVHKTLGVENNHLEELRDFLIKPPKKLFGSPTIVLSPTHETVRWKNPLTVLMAPHGVPTPDRHQEEKDVDGEAIDKHVSKIMRAVDW